MTTQHSMASFLKGAALLTLAGFFVKLLSAVYRVPFQNLVGDEGFYIYQQVYPFVAIFGIWTSYGFAVAVSKLLAEHPNREHAGILRTAFWLIAGISVLTFVTLYTGAGFFADRMGDPELSGLLRVGAFAVVFMAPLAIMKGRLQADGKMAPVASAQVTEQAVRVAVILIGSYAAVSSGLSLYAAGQVAIAAAGAGAFAAVILLIRSYKKQGPLAAGTTLKGTARKLLVTSLGISMSSLLLVLFQLVDSFTVYRLLAEQLGDMQAMVQKGVYDRAQPLVQFGILLATSLTLSLVPLIARTNRQKAGRPPELYASLAFRVSLLFAVAAAAGLTLVMPYVNEALFKTRDGSFALIIFNWQIVSMSLVLVLTAILYGYGKVRVPALLLVLGLMLKLVGNLLLVPTYGITGAALAGNMGLAFIAIALIWYFKKVWPLRFAPLRFYGWLTVAIGAMSIAVLGFEAFIVPLVSGWPDRLVAVFVTLTAVPLGGSVFLLAAAKSRLITEKEWYIIPFGRRLAAMQIAINLRKKRS
ncbi:polysaccharide biosynthesis protein [Planococcus sp. ISL-109]|uniref:putative polysaccharide biosynthesis protein n=1 Tax=Planococcus sp. ISL-109 TaxID=2819166 RepID=UPI001BE9B2AF|nr:polysaccharide biosynthesis protein [Planococcus sp. ISL-109]MBT2583841.1 polysaccharide biosynthesis protein [Planococcus sp. ISL-109]